MSFTIYVYNPKEENEDNKYRGWVTFETIEECFDFLAKMAKNAHLFVRAASLVSIDDVTKSLSDANKTKTSSIIYEPISVRQGNAALAQRRVDSFKRQNKQFIHIRQRYITDNTENLSWEQLLEAHAAWSRWNIARKVFHPGNSLTLAFILIAVGLGLGAACPPALVFVALGVAAFSAISTIGYAIDWLKRDWSAHEAMANLHKRLDTLSLTGYLQVCWHRLKAWVPNHKLQAIMMGIGVLLFIGALIVTTGGLAAPTVFGFMAMGASSGAIGVVSSFFSAGLGSAATLLTSIFTGAALIVGPTNIVDTIRRFASGIWKRIEGEENLLPGEPSLRVPNVEKNKAGDVGGGVYETSVLKAPKKLREEQVVDNMGPAKKW